MNEAHATRFRQHLASFATLVGTTPTREESDLVAAAAFEESLAVACLTVWQRSRVITDIERGDLRAAVTARHPECETLCHRIDQIHAMRDVAVLVPKLRHGLFGAATHMVPADLRHLPFDEQWLGMLCRISVGAAVPAVAAQVRDECEQLSSIAGGAVLHRAFTLTGAAGLRAAVAAFGPSYLRLRALNPAHGLAAAGVTAAEHAESLISPLHNPAAETVQTEISKQEAAEEAPGEDVSPRTLDAPSDTQQLPQRANALKQAADPALNAADVDWRDECSPQHTHEAARATPTRADAGHERAMAAEYRARLTRWNPQIEKMREVWRRVLVAGFDRRTTLTHLPSPDAGHLNMHELARTFAAVRSGAARPSAFRACRVRSTLRPQLGNTDYILVLDRSASMRGRTAEIAAECAMIMLEALAGVTRDLERVRALGGQVTGSIRTALILFDSKPTLVKPLSATLHEGERVSIFSALLRTTGSTNGGAALALASKELTARRRTLPCMGVPERRIVLYVSDGECDDAARLHTELAAMRSNSTEVFGIVIGQVPGMQIFEPYLAQLSGAAELASALQQIIELSTVQHDPRLPALRSGG